MSTKFCHNCSTDKPTQEFSKCSNCRDGLQTYCKACNKKANAKFRKEKPEYQKQYWSTPKGHQIRYRASQRYYSKDSGGIYIIKNLINGNIYVGQTSQFTRREVEWRAYLNNPHLRPLYMNEFFRAEVDKYGIQNFEWKILETLENATESELRKRERFYIKVFSKIATLYNKQHNGKKAK